MSLYLLAKHAITWNFELCPSSPVWLRSLINSLFTELIWNWGLKPEACNFIEEETPTQVFSCKFCEIFKNTFFIEYLWETASVFFWRKKKHNLNSKLERIKLLCYNFMFVLENFIQNLILGFFDSKKVRCKSRKRHI